MSLDVRIYDRRPQIPWPSSNKAVRVTADNIEAVSAWLNEQPAYLSTPTRVDGDRIVFGPTYSVSGGPVEARVGQWVALRGDGGAFVRDDDTFRDLWVVE